MVKQLFVLSVFLVVSCTNFGQLKHIADFPKSLDEVSGIVYSQDSTIWVVEDSGNKDEIYKVDFNGNILKNFKVKNAKNKDWEDLTKDSLGNVYIADTGNNDNDRKNLVIYKIPNPEIEKGDKIDAQKIEFNYPEQKDFPPKKAKRLYDAEAIFHLKNKLYLVTRNRSDPFDGTALLYTVPSTEGTYDAQLVGSINFCDDWETCQITSIAISPNQKKIVALSNGKLFVFENFTLDDFSTGDMTTIDLGARTQLESVCFLTDDTLIVADESSHGFGGNLYTYTFK
jgi:hypothetical protein